MATVSTAIIQGTTLIITDTTTTGGQVSVTKKSYAKKEIYSDMHGDDAGVTYELKDKDNAIVFSMAFDVSTGLCTDTGITFNGSIVFDDICQDFYDWNQNEGVKTIVGYQIIAGAIYQSGTNVPIFSFTRNTFPFYVTWTRSTNGSYYFNPSGNIPVGYCFCDIGTSSDLNTVVKFYPDSNNTGNIILLSAQMASGTGSNLPVLADDLLSAHPFKIMVFNYN